MTPQRLEREYQEGGNPAVRTIRRKTDKLLTLDRALLAGIFAAGAWYATTDLRAGNVSERVSTLEKKQEQLVERASDAAVAHAAEVATIQQQLKDIDRRQQSIEENLSALAQSTARLANSVKDPH